MVFIRFADYKYTFKPDLKDKIRTDEIAELLPLLIEAWKAPLTTHETVTLKLIPSNTTLSTKISEFPNDGLRRHFKESEKSGNVENVTREEFGNKKTSGSKPQHFFDPKKNITAHEIAQLLPLLTDAWKTLNTYEPVNHKKIPLTSVLHEQIGIGEFSKERLGRHFESVPMNDDTELPFQYEPNDKYFFNPKNDITDHDIAQVLPILIESWTNQVLPSRVKEKIILSDLNHKIYNLPEQTKENCFTKFSEPDSESVI